jgi:tetratricopeptide (TPR) repeat protein
MTASRDTVERVCSSVLSSSSVSLLDYAFANLHVGEARLRARAFDDAAAPLRVAADLFSGRAPEARRRALHDLAQALIGSMKPSEALAILDAALQIPGPRIHILLDRGEAFLVNGRLLEASADFREVVASARRTESEERRWSSRAGVHLGELALQEATSESLERARSSFETAARDDPSNPDAFIGLGRSARAMASAADSTLSTQYLTRALQAFEQAERLAPRSSLPVAEAGRTLVLMGRLRDAGRRFQRALELSPDTVELLLDLSRVLAASGQTDAAEEPLRRAIAVGPPDADILVELARIQLARRHPEEARASFEAAAAIDPGLATAFLGIGEILFAKGPSHFPAAREQFQEAQRLALRLKDASARGRALYFLSRIETEGPAPAQSSAIRLADEALAINGSNPEYRSQACLARIRFLDRKSAISSGETSGLCASVAEGPTPQARLLAGLHQLRLAQFADGDDRKRRWESAYKAFSDGVEALSKADGDVDQQLRSRLEMGQGMAYYCIGFSDIGRQMMERADKEARAFFDAYHVARCIAY